MAAKYEKNTNIRKRGFTLIEVLIVIFIIGMLASVILIGIGSFRARGRDARRLADLHSVQNALELYYQANGQYPIASGWNELALQMRGANIGVDRLPTDPSQSRDYFYGVETSRGQNYVLGAELDDSNNPVLKDDEDGLIYGVNCGSAAADNVYCLRF